MRGSFVRAEPEEPIRRTPSTASLRVSKGRLQRTEWGYADKTSGNIQNVVVSPLRIQRRWAPLRPQSIVVAKIRLDMPGERVVSLDGDRLAH